MSIRTLSFTHFGTALIVGGALVAGVAPAALESPQHAALRAQSSEVLSFAIADQGNFALESIRAESREAIRRWELAPLPAPAAEPAADALVADAI